MRTIGKSRLSRVISKPLFLAVAAVATAGVALAGPGGGPTCARRSDGSAQCRFDYNGVDGTDGTVQTFTVPPHVTSLTIDAYGAQGAGSSFPGSTGSPAGGLGGYEHTTVATTAGQRYEIRVGGRPSSSAGGFNGGGAGAGTGVNFGGGGASDVRPAGGLLADRIVTAGGGGGQGYTRAPFATSFVLLAGGAGGGAAGDTGDECDAATCGNGGTDTTGGAAGVSASSPCTTPTNPDPGALGDGGQGESCTSSSPGSGTSTAGGSGGGGGWYGGGGGAVTLVVNIGAGGLDVSGIAGSGGGGSGHVATGTDQVHEQGVRAGNGVVTITYNGALPKPVPPGGTISCFVSGTIKFPKPLRDTPSPKPITMKIKTTGTCDNSGVRGGKAPITDVSVIETVTFAAGATCSSTQVDPSKPQKILVKWQGRNAKNKLTAVATNNLVLGQHDFTPISVPATYGSSSAITKPKTAFVGSNVLHGLLVTEDKSTYDDACMSQTGLTLLHVNGEVAVP